MWSERVVIQPQEYTSIRALMPRMFLAVLFGSVAFRMGLGYIHLCDAGSRVVELSAALLVPLLASSFLFFVRRLWLGFLGALLIVLILYALRSPYLDYVHRPSRAVQPHTDEGQ